MLKRIIWLLVCLPGCRLPHCLRAANRLGAPSSSTRSVPRRPCCSLVMPFYAYLFGALLIGVILGGLSHLALARADGAAPPARARPKRAAGRPRPTVLRASVMPEVASRGRALAAPSGRRDAA